MADILRRFFTRREKPCPTDTTVQGVPSRPSPGQTRPPDDEKKYRQLVENAHEGILVAQGGRIRYANPKARELIGCLENAEAPAPLFLDPDEHAMVFERCRESAGDENIPYVYSFKVVGEDGNAKWIEIRAMEFRWEDRPATLNLLSDITSRKQADTALRKSEESYRLLVENAHDAIFVLQGGRIRFHNGNTERFFGCGGAELGTASFFNRIAAEDRDVVQDRMRRALAGEPSGGHHTFQVAKEDGKIIWAEANTVLISWEEGPALLCFLRDISEKRSLEAQIRQAQKMEAIGRLTGGVAHDFNNAMTIVTGFSDVLMLRLGKEHPNFRHLNEIKKAGKHAALLTRQLLAFSRKQVLHPQVVDLNRILDDTEQMLRYLIREDIELAVVPAPDLWRVKSDPGQIEQVLLNLAINARDAMPRGGRITVETRNVTLDASYAGRHAEVRPGEHVLLAVSDNGIGMDKGTCGRIFEPFFTTKAPEKGTGLGLSTVYGIVKQSGGTIWVYSEVGRGTTFKIYLPRTAEDLPVSGPMAAAEEAPSGSETVLIVEDQESIRVLVHEVLKDKGYKVLEAKGPTEALAIAETHEGPVHLLLTDLVMPEMGGRELGERLVSIRPDMKTLFMSGYTADVILHHGFLDPGINFLEKPFSPKALLQMVRRVLDR